jgi:hypothetical protein
MRRKDIWKRDASTGYQRFGARARHHKFDGIAWPRVRRLTAKKAAKQLAFNRLDRLPNQGMVDKAARLAPGKARERIPVPASRQPNEAFMPCKRPRIGIADMTARQARLRTILQFAGRTGARDDCVFYKSAPAIFRLVRSQQRNPGRTYIDSVSRYPFELAPPAWQREGFAPEIIPAPK